MLTVRGLLLVVMLLGIGGASAQNSDDALDAALIHWRAASWYVRNGNADVAAIEVESFRDKWQMLGPSAPAGVAVLGETAAVALETNDPATAGRTLAAIGDALAEARRQVGSAGFPEVIRAYRDAVERLSGLLRMGEQRSGASFADALRAEVRNASARTADVAARLEPLTPARWASDEKFRTLLRQNTDSLSALLAALDRPTPRATGLEVAGLINVVRSNYYLLFLSYGY